MQKLIILISTGFLLFWTMDAALAKPKATDSKAPVAADCVYQGTFSKIEPIKINGRDLNPISVSVGTFKVKKFVRGDHFLCASFKDEFDVIFSNGLAGAKRVGMSDGCSRPAGTKESYEIALSVQLDGTFMPADCHRWIRSVP